MRIVYDAEESGALGTDTLHGSRRASQHQLMPRHYWYTQRIWKKQQLVVGREQHMKTQHSTCSLEDPRQRLETWGV